MFELVRRVGTMLVRPNARWQKGDRLPTMKELPQVKVENDHATQKAEDHQIS